MAFPDVVSEAQFNQMFPQQQAPYSYAGLVEETIRYPVFANGPGPIAQQEAAAFLANVSHETGGLVYAREQNPGPNFCDTSTGIPCPLGPAAYFGRGSLMLSWNYNYAAAGSNFNLDLLNQPDLVATDALLVWRVGLWYWMTVYGAAAQTCSEAMWQSLGFGQTIMSINGGLECGPNAQNPGAMQDRVNLYIQFCGILGGVDPGANLTC